MRLTIAARQSDLARLQAQTVGAALLQAHQNSRFAPLEIDYRFRASLGDLNQHDPLWKMPEKGVFTEDFLGDLKEGRVDLVVHSWKDLPTEPRPYTEIVATLPRADARDLLLVRVDRLESARNSRRLAVLTSSPRRAHNLEGFFKTHLPLALETVEFKNVRGNIPTRMRKLLAEDVDALIVAKAALDRLLEMDGEEYRDVQRELRAILAQCRWAVLPLSMNPTAAAQGALAIEIRRDRDDLRQLLAAVNCAETFACVEAERRILASYGGGCHQKIGVNVVRRSFGEITFLRGLTDAGEVLDRVTLLPAESSDFPRAASAEALFERRALSPERWREALQRAPRILVARDAAWPEGHVPAPDQVVWAAGLKTWAKLAARGVWVHGSCESLGETEPARIETLAGRIAEGAPPWTKLTHEASAESQAYENGISSLATYRLVPKAQTPKLSGRTHFFWMSGSAFDRALELEPSIRSAHHSCGPGRTYQHLRERLGPRARIGVFLSLNAWRSAVLGA